MEDSDGAESFSDALHFGVKLDASGLSYGSNDGDLSGDRAENGVPI
jgi:hypothetical protein